MKHSAHEVERWTADSLCTSTLRNPRARGLDDVKAVLEEPESPAVREPLQKIRGIVHEPRSLRDERWEQDAPDGRRCDDGEEEGDAHGSTAGEAPSLERLHGRLERHRQDDRGEKLDEDLARRVGKAQEKKPPKQDGDERDERPRRNHDPHEIPMIALIVHLLSVDGGPSSF